MDPKNAPGVSPELPEDLPVNTVSLEILNGGHYYFVADAVNGVLLEYGVCR